MANITQAIAAGLRYHQAGQLANAEQIYRQVLQADPQNPQALHLLGNLAIDAGQSAAAIELISSAIRSDRSQAVFHIDLGEAYRRTGDIHQAVRCNQRAIEMQPRLVAAHVNLGLLQQQLGEGAAAVVCLRQAVRLSPQDARARTLLGQVLLNQAKYSDAEACFRAVARLTPDDARAHYHLGRALQSQQKLADAAESFRVALALNVADAETHNTLGAVLHRLYDYDGAEAHFRQAIAVDPNLASAHHNLAGVLCGTGRWEEAVGSYRKAIELMPEFAGAQYNLASCLYEAGRVDESLAATRKALEMDPAIAGAHHNLGLCLQAIGCADEAVEAFRQAARLSPDRFDFVSSLLYSLNYSAEIDPAMASAEHREWGQRFTAARPASPPKFPNDRTVSRRLRVGYVSPHFWSHAVTFFTEPILESHDRSAFEVFCYSDTAEFLRDQTTTRLRGYVDQWRDVAAWSDKQLADTIRRDQIDILVDLAGHIPGNRLPVFAGKPAPIQITYIGYQNTTGLPAMDYRLTDAWADPPGVTDPLYTEQLVRLPHCFFCYRPSTDAPPVSPLPALANGYVTFGSFNSITKLTPPCLALWARLLTEVEHSRLILLAPASDASRARLLEVFDAAGIDRDRIEICGTRPRQNYLELISRTDVALDPIPFNGHTTTCDSLWMGVPVVSLAGESYVSRFGGVAMKQLKLDELVTRTPDEYRAAAVRLAGDLPSLARLRAELRERMRHSPITDAERFTRDLEATYRDLWIRWCEQT